MRPIVPQRLQPVKPTEACNCETFDNRWLFAPISSRASHGWDSMILPVHDLLRTRLVAILRERYDLALSDQPAIAVDYAPTRALGDLALPVAFELARKLRKAPKAIAQDLAGALTDVEGVARVESTP